MKKNLPTVKLITFISLLFAVLFLTPKISAQSSITLTAIPPRVEIKALPGETVQQTIKIRNDTDTELVTASEIKDFIVIDDSGTPMPVEEDVSGRWSLTSWVSMAPVKNILQPKEIAVIHLVITVPEDALPGGHYAMVLHEPSKEGLLNSGSSAEISQKVGTLVYLMVEGPITEKAELVKFTPDKYFKEYGPVDFEALIRNLSDIHIRPITNIAVYNMLGQNSALLNLDEVNIFPFKTRSFQSQFPGKWHLGRYKAVLTAGYGTQGNKLTGVLYFWIIPWKLILLLVLVLLLVGLVYWKYNKKDKKKKAKKPGKEKNAPPPVEIPKP
ncbi:hypothetical protein ACFLZ1_03855 [Patescibacteria group bacterium]